MFKSLGKLLSVFLILVAITACSSSPALKEEKITQITEQNLIDFSQRSSEYMVKKEIRAIASLLHKNFQLIDNVSPEAPQSFNKFEYIKETASLMKVASKIKNNYKITSMSISPDKQSAYLTVEVVNQFLIQDKWKKSFGVMKYHILNSDGTLVVLNVDTLENRDISEQP